MARFIAIDVGVGDAFYLERKGFSVLVDGGLSTEHFPKLFSDTTGKKAADIVVCTHNDADHTNGIIGFLEIGYKCQEVWLPGRWADCLDGLMQSERDVFNTIVEGAAEFWESKEIVRREIAPSFEEIGEDLLRRLNENENNNIGRDTDNEIQTRYSQEDPVDYWETTIAEGIDKHIWSSENSHLYRDYIRSAPFLYNRIDFDIWRDWNFWEVVHKAIEAGEKIRRIAQAAYTNGIPVRWFDYNPAKPEKTLPDNLHVLSAGQIARVRPKLSLFHFLSLTVVNKESLVLYSPPDSDAPGVLFCADSDLENIKMPIDENDLITVPHHGAEANEDAYDRIRSCMSLKNFDSLIWVRSDSKSRKRPCLAYKNIIGQKFCTVCTLGPPKRSVRLNGNNNLWRRQKGIRICSCR